ncbi:hypothetical protein Taro_045049 [Colocasia esculenta]|uniref:HMA domain-containing protein n=1 Tax=Colocasia esculenta TaxID=4460 RepID=A0A843X460_COLES|nr:hypothetical protein [Colocasia esculenta]
MQPVVLKVRMSCQGCAGAVRRVLDKMEGVESFDINLEEQKVTVKGTAAPEAVLETVSKTGKKAEFWKAEAEAKEKEAPPTAAAADTPAPVPVAAAVEVSAAAADVAAAAPAPPPAEITA